MSDSEDDFLAEAQRKAKKSYLTEEIIQQNYSPRLFTQFCDQLRGADIDAYTFDELQEIVCRFKRKYKPGQVDEEEPIEPDSVVPAAPAEEPVHSEFTEPESEAKEEEKQPETAPPETAPTETLTEEPQEPDSVPPQAPEESKQPVSLPSPRPDSDSSEEQSPAAAPISRPESDMYFTGLNVEPVFSDAYPVSANYLPESELSAELNAKTTIVKFSVEGGGLLSSTHAIYEVQTHPFNWRVHRRESDFIWLKTVLQNAHPGYFVLPT